MRKIFLALLPKKILGFFLSHRVRLPSFLHSQIFHFSLVLLNFESLSVLISTRKQIISFLLYFCQSCMNVRVRESVKLLKLRG